ncbi:proliferating cell nuclear antigen (pcna) [Candidatus Woesearchaeota archaeon]|jgi:proliferating cell nuclear antigen|nr:proliferating cell nuclear antigen (pcna) [Candidatus Woesearchaeota archaeon]MBT4368734.1 proliferating cell nuclear antigen (pcna) [Candidatus Woesearchaeota archaeon]MBT4712023.1 proliferating cell nuclear antigen (pcna) [Candidatus Woesearchaeota archaeon]MBT6638918.1 proliferating cell nuclear antigen (pcna) [Candidatus Woesearchaeota archaeon]MBT7134562.1 proliferating cell nuclear antigen (pcna) [Candidatus Woesearchaeota archaeon]
MKLTLAEPKYLKESISIISELVNEAKFKVTSNGIEMIAMDPANVAMVVFKLLSSCFVEYNIKKETEIGINLTNLRQVLRRAKPTDAVTLEFGEDNKLTVILKSKTTRSFSIPVMELEDKEQKVPELAFPVIIETDAEVISEAIEDIGVVSESVTLICEQKKLILKGEGNLSKAQVEIESDKKTIITNDETDPVKAKYSIEYFKKIIGGSKLSDRVTLLFDKEYPMKLTFQEVDKVQLSFILAPRVENN